MILAVDAFNLAADRRGMGRYVRSVLAGLRRLGQSDLRLVVRNHSMAKALGSEFDYPAIEPRDLSARGADLVWYPWNGMRFDPHAPSIVTIYDPFAFLFPARGFVARRREQQPIHRALADANAITTISEWSAAELHRLFGVSADRLTIIPPVLDAFWHPVPPPHKSEYILVVSGPDARKNAGLFFQAFDDAFADGHIELIVAGQLNARDMKSLEHVRARKRLTVPSDDELRTLYSGALAVAVPSLAEGYGMPALEAMACGAPVVASSASALPEACAGAAVLVPPTDRGAWSAALKRVADRPELRAELRMKGLARIASLDPLAPARGLLELAQRLAA